MRMRGTEMQWTLDLPPGKDVGKYMDTGMEVDQVAEAVRYALLQPPGVAVDLLEIRPSTLTPKG